MQAAIQENLEKLEELALINGDAPAYFGLITEGAT
jgi:hypothetical protein